MKAGLARRLDESKPAGHWGYVAARTLAWLEQAVIARPGKRPELDSSLRREMELFFHGVGEGIGRGQAQITQHYDLALRALGISPESSAKEKEEAEIAVVRMSMKFIPLFSEKKDLFLSRQEIDSLLVFLELVHYHDELESTFRHIRLDGGVPNPRHPVIVH